MSFADQVKAWGAKAEENRRRVFERTVDLAFESVRDGSPVTGSPGQPEVTGRLKRSWTKEIQGNVGIIATDVEYAPWIEDAALPEGRPLKDGPSPGGPHSVKLTIAGLPRLVEQAVAEVVRA